MKPSNLEIAVVMLIVAVAFYGALFWPALCLVEAGVLLVFAVNYWLYSGGTR